MIKLRAGIIGLGVGEKHIDAYQSHPKCEVIALCDFDDKKISKAKEEYPGFRITKHAEDILNDPDIDVVSVASYDNYHFEQIMEGLENGKHLFVEKPLVLHFHVAVSIRRLLKENRDIQLSSNLNLRTAPRFVRLKEAVQSGEMGRVFYFEADYLWGRINKLEDGWRKNMDFYSIIHGAAVHMIDLLIWIMEMRPVEIQGYGNHIATEDIDFRYNDFAAILMKFKNGMIAKVSANGGCVHPHFHRVSVFGTEKTFFNDISGGKLIGSRNPKTEITEVTEKYPARSHKGDVITSFIDSIVDLDAKPVVSCDDVFATMSVCFAAEKSIQDEMPLTIEYI